MKNIFMGAAILALTAVPAMASDFTSFTLSTVANASPEKAWAKIGGVSPTVPASTAPALSPSRSCGPAGNSSHCTVTPCAASRLSSDPRAFRTTKLPYF